MTCYVETLLAFLRALREEGLSIGIAEERDALLADEEALRLRCAELEEKLQACENAPAAPIVPSAAPAVYTPVEELEIYRRAERTERMARERADLIYRQTSGVLGEASVRVNDVAAQVGPMADQILVQLSQLQNTVNTTRQSLQDAVVIINTLRPDNT